jgi:hypothetical protein
LERILEEKERYIESLRCENKKLVDLYRKVADDQEKKLSLEEQINKIKKDLLLIKKEKEELTIQKNDLENEVELKSNDIGKRDKMIVEKEREVMDAIEESNSLRLKIDTLQQQHSEDKEMSKKIEILEDELVVKENAIMDIRKKKTMTSEEIEEQFGNQEKKLVDLIKKQNETIDVLRKDQMASAKEQSEKIDFLTDALTKALNLQEKK